MRLRCLLFGAGAAVAVMLAVGGVSKGEETVLQTSVARSDSRFTVHGDGTVTDNMTGAMWVQAPHALDGNLARMSWKDAIDFCDDLTFAGYSDWRLPSLHELQSLMDTDRIYPALPSGYPFIGLQSRYYWTSCTHADFPERVWSVNLYIGVVDDLSKTYSNRVWPVRAGQ